MEKDYLTRQEIDKLKDDAHELASLDFEDVELYNSVKERTQLLIYEIPLRYFYIDDERAADLYLKLNEKLDKIMHSFRLNSSYDYIAYIIHIAKFECKHLNTCVLYKEKNKEYVIKCGLKSNGEFAYDEEYDLDNIYLHSTAPEYEAASTASIESIENILELIREAEPDSNNTDNPCVKSLITSIKHSKMYKDGLFFYILYNSDTLSCSDQEYYSQIFNVPQDIFNALSTHIYNIRQERKTHTKEKNERIRDKYWAKYLILEHEYSKEEDIDKKKCLEDKIHSLKIKLEDKKYRIEKAKVGLTYREIANAVKMSSSHICNQVVSTKGNLHRILEKHEDYTYFY